MSLGIEPCLLHHDLHPGHLVRTTDSLRLLLDWELAAFGDPTSDRARLAVRLRLPDRSPCSSTEPTQPPTSA